jgi:predicted O-linked N-acetylglucosamine transferase (SPINDLY family)
MANTTEAFAIAVQHHQAGRLEAAEQVYLQILRADPTHPDVLHLLGLVHAQTGHHRTAVEYIGRALSIRPQWAEALANLGNVLRELGRADEAVPVLRRALQLQPDHAAAHNNLGNALEALGHPQEAIESYGRAVALRPDFAEAHSNLGNALRARGDVEGAIVAYRRAVALRPDFPEGHYNLGIALGDLGKPDEAIASYRWAVALKPDYAEAHSNLGNMLRTRGDREEAIACYRRALALKPDSAAAHHNLGTTLIELGKPEEAIDAYRRAIALRPDFAEAHHNLGLAWNALGHLDEAVACYGRALALSPDHAEAHHNLGNALDDRGESDEAIACYRRALELSPDNVAARINLGSALKNRGDVGGAVACHRRALELRPDYAVAHVNLGNALKIMGDLDGALASYRRALELSPDNTTAHSNLLFTLQYCPGITPAALAEAHAEFDRRHAEPLRAAAPPHDKTPAADGRLRLGFVSPDLGRHPVGFFLVRVLENLRKEVVETICYSHRSLADGLTRRLQAASTEWRDVIGLNDERLASQIRADRIDILFDLAGHTASNRLLVFARKPAPIQISWIGYEGTTGLAAMDYLLADHLMIPPGSERHYRETVLRMPDGYLCYDPPESAPLVGPPPSLINGFATFGSFNNPAKITPAVVATWAKILHAAPSARLLMKYRGLGDPAVNQRFLDLFDAHDIGSERLDVRPWSSYADYLATYREVDVALDPFPFSGSTTTCESLWMGVPVITIPGETFASRHSLNHLTNVGLPEMIAHNLDDYVSRAVALAGDPGRLAKVRSSLRERMAASPLCDGRRFAGHLTTVLREVLVPNVSRREGGVSPLSRAEETEA